MTLQFKLGPRNSYGQAQVFIAPALSRTYQNVGQIVVSPDEHAELQRRLTQPISSETDEIGPGQEMPVAWHRFDDLSVALTIAESDGAQLVHLESMAVDSSTGEPVPVPLHVRIAADRGEGSDELWEGEL